MNRELRQQIELATGCPVVDERWACDVLVAHRDLIDQHNRFARGQGHAVEEKFADLAKTPQPLSDLLWADFTYLIRGRPELSEFADHFILAEVAGSSPNAEILPLDAGGKLRRVICYRSPLLHYLHSSFSKLTMMIFMYWHGDCVPEHDEIMKGEDYSDKRLMAGIFNDIEVFFDQSRLRAPITPPHLASPYNYCERVEGTRRFILAHEIGHAMYTPEAGDHIRRAVVPLAGFFDVDAPALDAWTEEIWCDAYAITSLLNVYADLSLTGAPLYELENALIGVMMFFTLLDVALIAIEKCDPSSESHPPALLRLSIARSALKVHPVYLASPELQRTLPHNWGLLGSFRRLMSGIYAPEAHRFGGFAAERKMYENPAAYFTRFGWSAYEALRKVYFEREARGLFDTHEEW